MSTIIIITPPPKNQQTIEAQSSVQTDTQYVRELLDQVDRGELALKIVTTPD